MERKSRVRMIGRVRAGCYFQWGGSEYTSKGRWYLSQKIEGDGCR